MFLQVSSSLVLFCLVASCHAVATAKISEYKNPIIPGFSPDPSCVSVKEGTGERRYFCVNSSFNAFPGVPVYTSRDLVQWQQIGNVVSRAEQLPDLALTNGSTSGIWAATIRFHDNMFYVTTTLVFDNRDPADTSRWDNLIFTNPDPFSNGGNGWSNPVHFSFPGYDTSPFWDDDGRVYMQGSHNWRVFPAIQQFEIDLKTGQSLSGDPLTIWTGTGGIAPEGPHIYKKDGFYYLMIAEGGTGLNHMETMARATNISGPYIPCSYNPVLTNANTTEYLQTVGHADLFQDKNNNWWAVALATRNGTVNFPMGRETVLVPVTWNKGEFPIFNGGKPGRVTVDMEGPLPLKENPVDNSPTDAILVGQDQTIFFEPGSSLPLQFLYLRLPDQQRYTISPSGHQNTLALAGSDHNLTWIDGRQGTSTFVGRRQDHIEFTANVNLKFSPKQEGEEAGLTIFLQQAQHFDLGIISLNSTNFVRLRTITESSTAEGTMDPISSPNIVPLPKGKDTFKLRVQANNASNYIFSINVEGSGKWQIIGNGSASEVSGGFVGTIVGMYATGNGENSSSLAYFSDFTYINVEDVY